MSFQGDVRGIGLAELLQGLARGRKEGLLTLGGDGRTSCLIGLTDGRLVLLPDEDEREEELAARIREAYAHGLEDCVEPAQIEALGGARRLESLYSLLDGGEVHFRFDPGDLAQLDAGIGPGSGTQLEIILLEYARISDELEGFPDLSFLAPNAVPQWVDPSRAGEVNQRVLAEIDGRSTIQEIGDRLAWPRRVLRLTLAGLFQHGALRLSTHQELLALTLQEMEARQFLRACQRLRAWVRTSPPGPLHPEIAALLSEEWVAGRLPASMRGMLPRETRALLRRLDASLGNPGTAVAHWNEAVQIHPDDAVCRMHAMGLQYAEDDRSDRPSVRDLLALARRLKELGSPARGAPLLLIAVQKKPEGVGQKLEVGLGLLEAGQPEHGGPWVLSAAHALVDRGQADRALGPLRMLIQAYPQSREAKALLTKAKRASTQAKKMRRNMAIGAAGLTLLAAGAFVKVRSDHKLRVQLDEVRALVDTPDAALAALNRYFAESESVKVLELRRRIEESQRAIEIKQKDAWLDSYKAAQEAAKNKVPSEALEVIRAVTPPPRLMLLKETWPAIPDLYELMGKRLASELSEQGTVRASAPAQIRMEQELLAQAHNLRDLLSEGERNSPAGIALLEWVAGFELDIQKRVDARGGLEEQDRHRSNLRRQDELRDQAEKAVAQGDYERALGAYEEILGGELDPRVREFVEPKAIELRSILEAIAEGRILANEGKHPQALALLQERISDRSNLDRIMLPWKVDSFPSGARVMTDSGKEYTTPFDIETKTSEALHLTFTSPGFAPEVVDIDRPGDLFIYLSRTPQVSWQTEGRVDAVPVPYEQDQIVVDRTGHIARIQPGDKVLWNKQIPTLSGVARAPVFFPGGSDKLLLVTEEGSAWFVSAVDGALEGPWDLKLPPRVGPLANSTHVHVMLSDGTWVAWREALQPDVLPVGFEPYDQSSCASYRYGPDNGMQVLRSREGEVKTLVSRFTGWKAEVKGDTLVVRDPEGNGGFGSKIRGSWTFLAWEPASNTYPKGRLWLSDEAGLRALVPRPE
ncbi:MAG: DUF4388 domain-containing protein [Planctomycetota bacterium]